jgi:hypothetical protein
LPAPNSAGANSKQAALRVFRPAVIAIWNGRNHPQSSKTPGNREEAMMSRLFPRKPTTLQRAGSRLRLEALEQRWMLAGAPVLSGGHLSVTGDDANNVIAVSLAGPMIDVTIDGTNYQYNPATVATISVDGAKGYDKVTLTGTAGNETITLGPLSATMSSPGIDLTVQNASEITADAAGEVGGTVGDVVSFYDSSGDDVFTASPGEGQMSGRNFLNKATGAEIIHAYAREGGTDTAHLYDSAGDDTFVGTATYGKLYGTGFQNRAKFFDFVHGYAKAGGTDAASLMGAAGADEFVGRPTWSKMAGEGYFNRVKFFDTVTATATNERIDTARLYDSAGDDNFTASPNTGSLSGTGYSLDVHRFYSIVATASSGGYDVAELIDSPGDDFAIGKPTETKLYNNSFSNTAQLFDVVHTYARNGGYDLAQLYDSAGDDRYYNIDNWAKMLGPLQNGVPEFYVRAKLFDAVYAYASAGGYDRAYFGDLATANGALRTLSSGGATNAFDAVFLMNDNGGFDPIYNSTSSTS